MNLHIFEMDDEGYYVAPEGYRISWTDIQYFIEDKRFTEPELAAEYWYAEKCLGDTRALGGRWVEVMEEDDLHRVLTLHRFASSPHYDEIEDGEWDG